MKNFINSIIVSVGYDNIDEPNLSDYQYQPEWLLKLKSQTKKYLYWQHIDNFLGNQFHTFKKNTTEYFSNSTEKFIYPIVLYSNHLFENHKTIDLSDVLINSIKSKRAKIVFFYITEGWFGETTSHYDWMENLTIKYNFDEDDLIVITSNLLAKENYVGNRFTIIPYNYFTDELFFALINKRDELNLKSFRNKYLDFIDGYNIQKHFICFNNLTKLHRLWMFYELMDNEKLKNKSILSLNKNTTDKSFLDIVNPTSYTKMIDYYRNYDSTVGYSYDTDNWLKDVQTGDSINIKAHLSTFVNVITETLTIKDVVFITEKTYKSIYVCQPFIIVGNTYSLKKLKELGFKTFSNWWDESYDDEIDFEKRMDKITKVLEEIASWDFDKCNDIRKEMRDVLIHNYNQMLTKDEIIKFYSTIKTDTKHIQESKLL
jgi:hypothetical protein